jgi:DegV family protein with EDD domain
VKRIPIELIDSQSASIGMAPAILQAAREAGEGLELAAIKSHLLDLLSRTHFLGSLDTLDYVRHSGRLNGALAVLGETFGLKPILALKEGEIIPAGVARSHSSACARIAQQIASLGEVEQLIAGESSAGAGQQLISTLKAIYNGDIPLYQLSAILTAHTGPGTVAVAAVIKER